MRTRNPWASAAARSEPTGTPISVAAWSRVSNRVIISMRGCGVRVRVAGPDGNRVVFVEMDGHHAGFAASNVTAPEPFISGHAWAMN